MHYYRLGLQMTLLVVSPLRRFDDMVAQLSRLTLKSQAFCALARLSIQRWASLPGPLLICVLPHGHTGAPLVH